ncbi:MAG: VOC family protein [Actinomycetota bacterium]
MIRHVQHCNVNCSSLERSLAFYRDELGLSPLVRTNPDPQDGTGFGIDGPAQWDAWMMSDGRANPVIDLLEWKVPTPVGRPQAENGIGLTAIRLEHPNASEATTIVDPDGTPIELTPGDVPRIAGIAIGVRDVDASTAWYRSVLGLDDHNGALSAAGDDFSIELREGDGTVGAYDDATNLGVFRMAFLVDDAADAVGRIRTRGAQCPDPVWLDMGPTIPIDGLWAAFFRDPDGACLEFIQAPEST